MWISADDWKFGGTSSIANNNDERRDHFAPSLGVALMVFLAPWVMPCHLSLTALRRRALPITPTDDRDIAAAAAGTIGDNSNPGEWAEDASGNWHPGGIIGKGKKQVLADVAHGGAG